MEDYTDVTREDFENYMRASEGRACYMVEACEKSGISANKFIYISDNIDYFIKKFEGE